MITMKKIRFSAITAILLSLIACSPKVPDAATQTAKNSSPATVIEDVKPENAWHYFTSEDKMSGDTVYFANVHSSNTVDFAFPYNGEQTASVTLTSDSRPKKSVMFSIEKGQILCQSYQDCLVQVRFDDSPPAYYKAVGASDQSTTTIHFRDGDKFFKELQKAKRLRIAAEMYQEGSPVFEFDVSAFDLQQFLPKK